MDLKDIRSVCYRIIDLIDYMDNIKKQHDCNDCLAKNDCPECPKPGQFTRINCYAWVGDEKNNLK